MAFCGEYTGYSGLWGKIKKQFSRWETSIRKEVERTEQMIRPVTKAVLPVVGAVAGTILLPGLGTVVGASIGGAVTSAGQAVYETEKAKKEAKAIEEQMAAETAAYQQMAQEPYAEQLPQQAVQAGVFSKPSNLMVAGILAGSLFLLPTGLGPIPKKKRRRRKRGR